MGILLVSGQFTAFWFGLISSAFTALGPDYTLPFFVVTCAIAGVLAIVLKEDLKRLEYSKRKIAKIVQRLDALESSSFASGSKRSSERSLSIREAALL